MTAAAHPAKFSDSIIAEIAGWLEPGWVVLDPFAGVGRVHELAELAGVTTVGLEIEREWAEAHPLTICGDVFAHPFMPNTFDAIVTSPTYGNRMADHHNAKDGSKRITYRHTLGRPLHPNNSGQLQWGLKYREFHDRAYRSILTTLKPGGFFICNVSDHIRKSVVQPVSSWHAACLASNGLTPVEYVPVSTPRMRRGQNHEARVANEWVLVFQKGQP